MKILIACECSGAVRDAFAARGHHAVSCDLRPSETPGRHIQGNALDVLRDGWDMLIAHPPCTYLSSSGLHWNKRTPGRDALTEDALRFALALWDAPIAYVCMENPIGRLTRVMRERRVLMQTIQPYQFGHDASKATCLMLRGLPPLRRTGFVEPRMVDGKPRWANQTDGGQNRLGPSDTRAQDRSRTYAGIADAMAAQWGSLKQLEAA